MITEDDIKELVEKFGGIEILKKIQKSIFKEIRMKLAKYLSENIEELEKIRKIFDKEEFKKIFESFKK